MTKPKNFKRQISIFTPLLVLLISMCFYYHQYFLRVSIEPLGPIMMKSLHFNAISLATIAAFYYYFYMFTQFFSGGLIDRYGSKIMLVIATLLVTIGCLIFGLSKSSMLLDFSRALMGIGSAFSFVSVIKLGKTWFGDKAFSLINGLTQSVGTLGAIIGTLGLNAILTVNDWRYSLFIASGITFILVLLTWFFIDDPADVKTQCQADKKTPFFKHLVDIQKMALKNKHVWIHGVFLGLIYSIVGSFTSLWSISYYAVLYHSKSLLIDSIPALLFTGIAVGAILFSYLNTIIKKTTLLLKVCAFLSLIFSVIIMFADIPIYYMAICSFVTGYFIGGTVLSFYLINHWVIDTYRGASIAIANLLQMSVGAILLPIMGSLLEYESTTIKPMSLSFSISEYHSVFLLIIGSLSLGCLISLFITTPLEMS